MTRSNWKGGSTRRWRRTRSAILRSNLVENEGACQLAIVGVCEGVADTVHHTLGISVTGDDRRYLVATCTPCNLHVGDPSKRQDPPPSPSTKW